MESKILYHYTSLRTFYEIIRNKEFRLFDITKSNDPLEGIFLINAIKKAYLNMYKNSELTKQQYHIAHRSFFDFESEIYTGGRLNVVYAAMSFCEPEHELSLWRGYGDNGKGIAVGISFDILKKIADDIENMEFKKITYLSDKEIENIAKSFWNDIFAHKIFGTEKCIGRIKDELLKQYEESYFIKHDANKDENEYRLLYRAAERKNCMIPFLMEEIPQKVDFHVLDDDIKLFYSLELFQHGKSIINNIKIGPLCKADNLYINMFMKKNDVQINCTEKADNIAMR